eukprot:TRINITY_DN8746_c0_g1_i1.p1 TRINITY_DN8746_c0_g1~~TRINITY_DN8746_c0_g1_i1.p1  ORF type:complete len:258 (-),score=42.34 TRINITY_DN8746_c0_g1_i1:705-1370(-)
MLRLAPEAPPRRKRARKGEENGNEFIGTLAKFSSAQVAPGVAVICNTMRFLPIVNLRPPPMAPAPAPAPVPAGELQQQEQPQQQQWDRSRFRVTTGSDAQQPRGDRTTDDAAITCLLPSGAQQYLKKKVNGYKRKVKHPVPKTYGGVFVHLPGQQAQAQAQAQAQQRGFPGGQVNLQQLLAKSAEGGLEAATAAQRSSTPTTPSQTPQPAPAPDTAEQNAS